MARWLAAWLLVGSFALCEVAECLDLAEIKAGGSLRVLVSAGEEREVFSLEASPTAPGFERELIEAFARLHKLKIRIVRVSRFSDIIPALKRGEGDVIMGILDTESRRKLIDFSIENIPSYHVAVTRRPYRTLTTGGDLRDERVGVVVGTSWAEAARDAGVPARSLATYDDVGGVLAALRSGAVTATVMSVSNATLARRRDPALQIGVDLPGDSGSVAWGVRKTDPALLRALNDYLGGVRRTATGAGSW